MLRSCPPRTARHMLPDGVGEKTAQNGSEFVHLPETTQIARKQQAGERKASGARSAAAKGCSHLLRPTRSRYRRR